MILLELGTVDTLSKMAEYILYYYWFSLQLLHVAAQVTLLTHKTGYTSSQLCKIKKQKAKPPWKVALESILWKYPSSCSPLFTMDLKLRAGTTSLRAGTLYVCQENDQGRPQSLGQGHQSCQLWNSNGHKHESELSKTEHRERCD